MHGDDHGAERRDDQESVALHSKLHPATRARRPAAQGAGKVERGKPPQPVTLLAMRDRAPEGSIRAPRQCPCSTRAFWRTYARRCGARERHDSRCQHRPQAIILRPRRVVYGQSVRERISPKKSKNPVGWTCTYVRPILPRILTNDPSRGKAVPNRVADRRAYLGQTATRLAPDSRVRRRRLRARARGSVLLR